MYTSIVFPLLSPQGVGGGGGKGLSQKGKELYRGRVYLYFYAWQGNLDRGLHRESGGGGGELEKIRYILGGGGGGFVLQFTLHTYVSAYVRTYYIRIDLIQ